MSKPIIQIEHVSAEYDGKQVLKDINLTVYQDDYLGIIGPMAVARPHLCASFWD